MVSSSNILKEEGAPCAQLGHTAWQLVAREAWLLQREEHRAHSSVPASCNCPLAVTVHRAADAGVVSHDDTCRVVPTLASHIGGGGAGAGGTGANGSSNDHRLPCVVPNPLRGPIFQKRRLPSSHAPLDPSKGAERSGRSGADGEDERVTPGLPAESSARWPAHTSQTRANDRKGWCAATRAIFPACCTSPTHPRRYAHLWF